MHRYRYDVAGVGEVVAVYRVRKPRLLEYALLCAGFVVIGVTLVDGAAAWYVTGFFGLGLVVFLLQVLPNASYLRLTRDGFEIRNLFRTSFVPWSEVVEIGWGREFVGFTFAEGASAPRWRHLAYKLMGAEGILPDTYGHKPEALAEIMMAWKQRSNSTR